MKPLVVGLMLLTTACSGLNNQRSSQPHNLTKEEALNIARQEIIRRGIKLPPGTFTTIREGTINVEVGPDIAIYSVAFFPQNRPRSRELYSMGINRLTGTVEDFTDTSRLIPAGR